MKPLIKELKLTETEPTEVRFKFVARFIYKDTEAYLLVKFGDRRVKDLIGNKGAKTFDKGVIEQYKQRAEGKLIESPEALEYWLLYHSTDWATNKRDLKAAYKDRFTPRGLISKEFGRFPKSTVEEDAEMKPAPRRRGRPKSPKEEEPSSLGSLVDKFDGLSIKAGDSSQK